MSINVYRKFRFLESTGESLGISIFKSFVKNIYKFSAERLNIGTCVFENNPELKSDASNLAEVLCILQGKDPGGFAKFNELVSTVLPQIKWISVLHKDNSNVEIFVWTIDIKSRRDDLSFPLSSCGSGVSQVLAIIYILVYFEEPKTLIIDEPQSFLHPGAAKKLIEIINSYTQHQYFIATHSPDIITNASSSNIIKLEYQDYETVASVIDVKDIKQQQLLLTEIGVSLSDFFGADNILWVEEETEEKCFPLIFEKVSNKRLMGTKIIAVKNTGDLEGKRASIIFEVYRKLSEGASLFPPAIGFLFDPENRTEEQKKKWEDRSKKPVEFLSRRMYENFLLEPEAIAVVFNEESEFSKNPLDKHPTSHQIKEWIESKVQEGWLNYDEKKQDCLKEEWLIKVHGAKLLELLFREVSGSKLQFRKLKHSYRLTEWLVENNPSFLSGIAGELENMLK